MVVFFVRVFRLVLVALCFQAVFTAHAYMGSLPVGDCTSMASDPAGAPRAAYLRDGKLYHAYWDGEWHEEVVTIGGFSDVSLVIDASGASHIAACHPGRVAYFVRSGLQWSVTNLKFSAQHLSLALNSAGIPHIAFFEPTSGALRLIKRITTTWQSETVDAVSGNWVGRFVRMRIGADDRIHLVYAMGNYSLAKPIGYRHATKLGNTPWSKALIEDTSYVETALNFEYRFCDMTLIDGVSPRVIYFLPHATNALIRIADLDQGTWSKKTLESPGPLHVTSVAIDGASYPTPYFFTKTSSIQAGTFDVDHGDQYESMPSTSPRRGSVAKAGSNLFYWSWVFESGKQYILSNAPLRPGRGRPCSDTELIESKVRETLGLPVESPITQTDWDHLTHFTLEDRAIKDVSALRNARYLVELDLSGNIISDLTPIGQLPFLRTLRLSGNRIFDPRPLLKFRNLTWLDLSNNCLDLSGENGVGGCVSLLQQRATVLAGTQTSIWNHAEPALNQALRQQLGLPPNMPFDFDDHARLKSLTALGKGIKDLTGLSEAKNLKSLILSGNNISDIGPLRGLNELTDLNIAQEPSDSSGIRDLSPILDLPALTEVNIDGHRLTDIRALISSSVQFISLANNALTTAPDSEDALVVAQLRQAISVFGDTQQRCSWNWELDPALAAAIRSHYGLGPTAAFSTAHAQGLFNLNAAERGVKSLAGLDQAINLDTLQISNNEVEDLSPLAWLPNLTQLSAWNNRLTDPSPLLALPSLQFVNLDQNYLDDDDDSVVRNQIAQLQARAIQLSWEQQKCPWNVELDCFLAHDIRQQLGIPANAPFDVSDPLRLYDLQSMAGVRSLKGLQRARNLGRIFIREHGIEDLSPLANLSELHTLTIVNDYPELLPTWPQLEVKPLANLAKLSTVELRNNRVASVKPLFLLPRLHFLDVGGNCLGEEAGLHAALTQRNVQVIWGEQLSCLNVVLDPLLARELRPQWSPFEIGALALTRTMEAPPGVRSLEGLQYATSLKYLFLANHRASDLSPLAGLASLQWLMAPRETPAVEGDVAGFSDLSPLSGLGELSQVDLRNNRVVDVVPLLHPRPGIIRLDGNFIDMREGTESRDRMRWLGAESEQRCPWDVIMEPALYDAIRRSLGAEGRLLTQDDMDRVFALSADETGISSLRGLELARNLRSLSLANNSVRDLTPLGELENLETLELSNNFIRDIEPLRSLPALAHLDLAGNEITKISALSSLPVLTFVNLNQNGLNFRHPDGEDAGIVAGLRAKDVEVWDGEQRCSWNWILDPALEAAIRTRFGMSDWDYFYYDSYLTLRSLDARGRGIKHLEGLEEAVNLEVLVLEQNQLESVAPLARLPNLQSVSLSEQSPGIGDVSPFATLPQLKFLDLNANHVSDISPLLASATLETLRIGNNGLDPRPASDDYAHVQTLIQRGVEVEWSDQVSPATWELDPTLAILVRSALGGSDYEAPFTFEEMESLEHLNFPSWSLSSLRGLQHAINLVELQLGPGSVSDLSPLMGLSKLAGVSLAGNEVIDLLPLLTLPKLSNVDLSGNRIDFRSGSDSELVSIRLVEKDVSINFDNQRLGHGKLKQYVHFTFPSDTIPFRYELRLNAFADSSLPVTFELIQGNGEIRGDALVMNTAGLFVVRARQPGDAVFQSAETVRQLTVTKLNQTIEFSPVTISVYTPDPITLAATASSMLPVEFSVVSGPAEITGDQLRLTAAGTITIRASQPGDGIHFPASAEQTVEIGKDAQSLAFAPAEEQQLPAGGRITLNAASNTSTPITYEILSGSGRIEGSELIPSSSGPFQIRAKQAATSIYNEASVGAAFTVLKRDQVISFSSAAMVYQSEPITLSAESSLSLPVTFEVLNGPGGISGNQLTLLHAGLVVVRASHPGDSLTLPAYADATFEIGKQSQTLQVSLPGTLEFTRLPRTLSGSSSANLPVIWTIASGPGVLYGDKLMLRDVGLIRVRATQPGTNQVSEASPVDRVIRVVDTTGPGLSCPKRMLSRSKFVSLTGSLRDNHLVDYIEFRIDPPDAAKSRWTKLQLSDGASFFRLRVRLNTDGRYLIETRVVDRSGNKSPVRKTRITKR